MSAQTDRRVQFGDGEVLTPKLRTTARRSVFWIVIALILVLLAAVSLLTIGVTTSKAKLSATNPGPAGAEALVNVLRADGVTVNAPRTIATATKDLQRDSAATTLAIYDPTSILADSQLRSLRQLTPHLILIQPTAHELAILAPGVNLAGNVQYTAKADCDFRPVQRAGEVSGLQQGYRVTDKTIDAQGCLGTGGVFSLVVDHGANQTVTILGSTTILTNQSILLSGNAALALGVFGSTKHLVWYRPSFGDTAGVVADGILPNPPWVFLSVILAGLVVVAAGVWRGRRLGPVVVERMPVTVRASETLEGRARLYQKAGARRHALDALRIGAISRMATLCGLPTLATVDEVIGAIARSTGREVAPLRALLLDDSPTSDAQLVRLSDELRTLEEELTRAVVPA